MPSTYTPSISGTTGSPTFISAFTNTTGQNHTIVLKNSFVKESRSTLLDLSSYAHPGFSLYKVDVNVTGNQVVAQDDWVHINKLQTTTPYERTIDNATMRSYN
ncbi:MAG: hypothetical protein GYA24_02565, partial [Candidatus Lokiarchaeota archaeon]|nr:hypothetical protein [Candidatus Lokiarchaeota archaeon]